MERYILRFGHSDETFPWPSWHPTLEAAQEFRSAYYYPDDPAEIWLYSPSSVRLVWSQ